MSAEDETAKMATEEFVAEYSDEHKIPPYSGTPKKDGVASAGDASTGFACGNHVHPTDTSRMAANATGADIAVSGSDATKIDAALAGKADKVVNATGGNLAALDANGNLADSGKKPADFAGAAQFAAHRDNTDIHITATERSTWNSKYGKPSGGIPKSDLAEAVRTSLGKADTAIQSHQSLDAYVNAAGYDSDAKEIQLKHGSTVLATIDATAFIKDGMISEVKIVGSNLVITFNADAGKESISIPLSQIFNPANYYDKTAADNRFVQKEAGKGLVAVDAALSTTSENPVQNKAVAAALAGRLDGAAAYPAWESAGIYGTVGTVVSHAGRLWRNREPVTELEPGTSGVTEWEEVFLKDLKQDKLSAAQIGYINAVPDKADKAVPSAAGNLASLDSSGNLADSGVKASDFAAKSDLPYAMVTPGEWEFSGIGYDPSKSYSIEETEQSGVWYYDLEVDGGYPDQVTSQTKLDVVNFPNVSLTATRNVLHDRAGNRVVVSGDTTLTLPDANPGYLRDFLVRLSISGSTVPTITFQGQGSEAPNGADEITYETDGDAFPVPDEEGDWLYSFTESCVAHKFAVSLKKVNEVLQGGS